MFTSDQFKVQQFLSYLYKQTVHVNVLQSGVYRPAIISGHVWKKESDEYRFSVVYQDVQNSKERVIKGKCYPREPLENYHYEDRVEPSRIQLVEVVSNKHVS